MQSRNSNFKTDVATALRADILTCKITPGAQINEAQACKTYSTSRTKLREAFIELAAGGFIHLERNKGAVAAPLDAALVFSVFEARMAAEKAAAALAAVRATPDERAALSGYLTEIDEAQEARDLDAFFAVDRSVHDSIAALSRNPFIATQVTTYRRHTARCWAFYRDRGLKEHPDFDGLVAIISGVADAKPDAASQAMHDHLRSYLTSFTEMLSNQMDALKWV